MRRSCYFGKVEEVVKFAKRRLFQLNEEGVECGHEKLIDQSILANLYTYSRCVDCGALGIGILYYKEPGKLSLCGGKIFESHKD